MVVFSLWKTHLWNTIKQGALKQGVPKIDQCGLSGIHSGNAVALYKGFFRERTWWYGSSLWEDRWMASVPWDKANSSGTRWSRFYCTWDRLNLCQLKQHLQGRKIKSHNMLEVLEIQGCLLNCLWWCPVREGIQRVHILAFLLKAIIWQLSQTLWGMLVIHFILTWVLLSGIRLIVMSYLY